MMAWAWIISGVFLASCVPAIRWAGRFGPLGSFVAALFLGAFFFEVVFPGYALPGDLVWPGLAMALARSPFPLPLPSTAFWTFMGLLVIGGLVVATSDDRRMRAFFAPILRFLRGGAGSMPGALRLAVLYGLIPLAVGWTVLRGFMPAAGAPIESRQAHPTLRYDTAWRNPLRNPDGARLEVFAEQEGLSGQPREGLLERFRESVLHEGRHLYGKHCVPCHGAKADGTGIMSRGFRLQPADFTDPGTIATVVESYAYQRILDGGIRLPMSGSPWDSAMPTWKGELSDEEIHKILLAVYDLAGVFPRMPEEPE